MILGTQVLPPKYLLIELMCGKDNISFGTLNGIELGQGILILLLLKNKVNGDELRLFQRIQFLFCWNI